jgi:uncharacterized damage-inducible protein DinB
MQGLTIASKTILDIEYKDNKEQVTKRHLEPICLIFYAFNWHLTNELDFAKNSYKPTDVANPAELISFFEKSLTDGKAQLAKASDEQLKSTWTMRSVEIIHAVEPKDEMLRTCFCPVVHHRAQLGVYLRLLNVPIPGSYGPSADEQSF